MRATRLQDIPVGNKTTVYYDGACPLCSAEISIYRKRAARVDFVDVSSADGVVAHDLSQEQAMKRFHVRAGDGVLLDGGAAFAELWRHTPGFRFLGHLLRLPGLTPIANFAYDRFLSIRPFIQKIFLKVRGKHHS